MPETSSTASKSDPDRFYCPFEGCNRSFAELWRLKVHYRAAPDIRGSGKERGHGAELEACPKCGAELKPGRHHVGCAAGKRVAAQMEKRRTLKGRKRTDCRNTALEKSTSEEGGNGIAQGQGAAKSTTALGVPVSWMPLDFDQFFLPMQNHSSEALRPIGMTDADSVDRWVYGNHGELPQMAMAQVALDADYEMDFSSFFHNSDGLDPLMDATSLQTIKEETSFKVNGTSDLFPATLSDPLYDELDKYLIELPDARSEERETVELIGKKRERRSSLEQRLEQRNGKEPNRRCSIVSREVVDRQQSNTEINMPNTDQHQQQQHNVREASTSFLSEFATPILDPHLGDSGLPFEMPLEALDFDSHPLQPFSFSRGNDVGLLVQDLVGFDILRSEDAPQSLAQEKGDN